MMPLKPWPKPTPWVDCKVCGHEHGVRCKFVLAQEGDITHLCGCEDGVIQKPARTPMPSSGTIQHM